MTPVIRISLMVRRASEAWPWLPICVASFGFFAAVSRMSRVSQML
jgi:hypothetical protein